MKRAVLIATCVLGLAIIFNAIVCLRAYNAFKSCDLTQPYLTLKGELKPQAEFFDAEGRGMAVRYYGPTWCGARVSIHTFHLGNIVHGKRFAFIIGPCAIRWIGESLPAVHSGEWFAFK
jgi:hypothetical protein